MSHPEYYVPVTLLHEADGHEVTVETKSGDTYQGKMVFSEDNFNIQLVQVIHINHLGIESVKDNVFIRGSDIVFVRIPDIFSFSPYFKEKPKTIKGSGKGYGGELNRKKIYILRNRLGV